MVCSADDLLGWKDFPKGLRVLLLDQDDDSAADIRSKLQQMDYIVSTFCNEDEALEAISQNNESFHVAIVEVNVGSSTGSFKFLEQAKNLPTIMVSNVNCLSTMMKCIALGAAEFLLKPLSEDKLRNIWQHVVHKAFNAGGSTLSKSLEPIKEIVASMLQLERSVADIKNQSETDNAAETQEHEQYPAPSTPQLEVGRLSGDGDANEQENCPIKFEANEQDGHAAQFGKLKWFDSKSVENTNNHSYGITSMREESGSELGGQAIVDEEVDSGEGSKIDECYTTKDGSTLSHDLKHEEDSNSASQESNKKDVLNHHNSCNSRAKRKKLKVDWTPDLHKRFVQAVEQLGMDQAIPSKILELMKVEGLTRHNVASHLQKYRMQRKHILPKEGERRWLPPPHRDTMQRPYSHKPLMAHPSYHSNYGVPTPPLYPAWGQPIWGHPGYSTWPWKTYPPMYIDAWGCPVVPPQVTTLPHQLNATTRYPGLVNGVHARRQRDSYDLQPAEEVIDKVVKEVMNQPWLPLPLGLKPPSTESVLSELHRQGVALAHIPSHSTC